MKRFVTLSVFIAVAIITWWSTSNDDSDNQQLQQLENQQYIEIFMNSFEITAMDEAGTPAYTLNGEHLKKYNDTDNTEIQQPVLQLLQNTDNQNDSQWRISADSAIVNDKNETIQLMKNVVMQQQNIEPAVTIRTQALLIHTDTQIAHTKTSVEITQGNSHLKSNGMTYNNIIGELELLSNVSGHFLGQP